MSSFNAEDRRALLHFTTGMSFLPMGGFAHLPGGRYVLCDIFAFNISYFKCFCSLDPSSICLHLTCTICLQLTCTVFLKYELSGSFIYNLLANNLYVRVVATTPEKTHNQIFLTFEAIFNRFFVQF